MFGQVEFLGVKGQIGVQTAEGVISLVERDGRVVEVVVEEVDGGATFIPAAMVLSYKDLSNV